MRRYTFTSYAKISVYFSLLRWNPWPTSSRCRNKIDRAPKPFFNNFWHKNGVNIALSRTISSLPSTFLPWLNNKCFSACSRCANTLYFFATGQAKAGSRTIMSSATSLIAWSDMNRALTLAALGIHGQRLLLSLPFTDKRAIKTPAFIDMLNASIEWFRANTTNSVGYRRHVRPLHSKGMTHRQWCYGSSRLWKRAQWVMRPLLAVA